MLQSTIHFEISDRDKEAAVNTPQYWTFVGYLWSKRNSATTFLQGGKRDGFDNKAERGHS